MNALSPLERELRCTICDQFFVEPQSLPCGHIFCRHCVVGKLHGVGIYKNECPSRGCTQPVWRSDLKLNTTIQAIVHHYTAIQAALTPMLPQGPLDSGASATHRNFQKQPTQSKLRSNEDTDINSKVQTTHPPNRTSPERSPPHDPPRDVVPTDQSRSITEASSAPHPPLAARPIRSGNKADPSPSLIGVRSPSEYEHLHSGNSHKRIRRSASAARPPEDDDPAHLNDITNVPKPPEDSRQDIEGSGIGGVECPDRGSKELDGNTAEACEGQPRGSETNPGFGTLAMKSDADRAARVKELEAEIVDIGAAMETVAAFLRSLGHDPVHLLHPAKIKDFIQQLDQGKDLGAYISPEESVELKMHDAEQPQLPVQNVPCVTRSELVEKEIDVKDFGHIEFSKNINEVGEPDGNDSNLCASRKTSNEIVAILNELEKGMHFDTWNMVQIRKLYRCIFGCLPSGSDSRKATMLKKIKTYDRGAIVSAVSALLPTSVPVTTTSATDPPPTAAAFPSSTSTAVPTPMLPSHSRAENDERVPALNSAQRGIMEILHSLPVPERKLFSLPAFVIEQVSLTPGGNSNCLHHSERRTSAQCSSPVKHHSDLSTKPTLKLKKLHSVGDPEVESTTSAQQNTVKELGIRPVETDLAPPPLESSHNHAGCRDEGMISENEYQRAPFLSKQCSLEVENKNEQITESTTLLQRGALNEHCPESGLPVSLLEKVILPSAIHDRNELRRLREFCERQGNCVVVMEFTADVTHVVTESKDGEPDIVGSRSLKYLCGVAKGCWVLNFDWVRSSVRSGRWLCEGPFELKDKKCGQLVSAAAQSRMKLQRPLFEGQTIYFLGKKERKRLTQVARCAGATVLEVPPEGRTLREPNLRYICSKHTIKVQECEHIHRTTGRWPVLTSWLMDSVAEFTLLDIDSYQWTSVEAAERAVSKG